jgi:hypothetical protein
MRWRIYVCSACEDEENPYRYVQPVPDDAHPTDYPADRDVCPQCDETLSFTAGGVGEILVFGRTKRYGDIQIEPEGKLF